ncbi:MAG TPA: hypothetical protein VF771_20020 [Longimicrobiaceae bacterium]
MKLEPSSRKEQEMGEVNPRPLVAAAYPVGALLFLIPGIEVTAGAWPFQTSELSWRFGVAGILMKTMVTPLLGLLLAMAAAAYLEHRRVLRSLSVVAMAIAVLTVVIAAMFSMDFLQLRAMVTPAQRTGMTVASATALLMAALVVPTAAALGLGGWKATRRIGATRSKARAGLVVAAPQPEKAS